MRVTARVDYGLRALLELARREGGAPLTLGALATAQSIPPRFLESILAECRRAGLVASVRGNVGGYRLARPAAEVTVADVIRGVEGPLATVRGVPPQELADEGSAAVMRQLWVASRASLRSVLEAVTLADLASGALPAAITDRLADPDAWAAR